MFVEFIRLSLFEREQRDAFEARQPNGRPHTRETWLRYLFSRQIHFRHRGDDFIYAPDEELKDADFVIGRIGRQRTVRDNAPPEEGLHERLHGEWQASIVIIDPKHHADGQKVAMQSREVEIGKCVPVFQSLVYSLNGNSEAPYFVEAFGVVDPESFWDFVRKNKGEIVSLTFDAAAPNMFGSKDDFDKELRQLRDREKVRKTKIQLQNEDGLQPDTKRMREVVDYAVQGGGSIKAKTRRNKSYNSRNKTRRVHIPESGDPEKVAEYLADAVRKTLKEVLSK